MSANGYVVVPEPSQHKNIEEMTDREIAEETLTHLRTAVDALTAFQSSGMNKMMSGLLGPLFGGR